MKLSPNNAHNSVRRILTLFNKKWYPNGQKQIFLDVFSLNSWSKLSVDEKNIKIVLLVKLNILRLLKNFLLNLPEGSRV